MLYKHLVVIMFVCACAALGYISRIISSRDTEQLPEISDFGRNMSSAKLCLMDPNGSMDIVKKYMAIIHD